MCSSPSNDLGSQLAAKTGAVIRLTLIAMAEKIKFSPPDSVWGTNALARIVEAATAPTPPQGKSDRQMVAPRSVWPGHDLSVLVECDGRVLLAT